MSQVPASLRSRIQAYLAARAAEDPAARAAAVAAAADELSNNPVAAYLGVTVVSVKRKAEVAKAGPLDPLNYLELNRLGFGDLVHARPYAPYPPGKYYDACISPTSSSSFV